MFCFRCFFDLIHLSSLIKQPMSVRYDPMDMAVLPMPTFSSLFNAVFLPSSSTTPTLQQALEKIYRKTKVPHIIVYSLTF